MKGMQMLSRWVIFLLLVSVAWSAELIIDTDSTVIDGGTYDMIEVKARYVTIRNATVRNTTGNNYYAAVYLNGSKYTTVENCIIDGGASAVRGKGSCGGIKLNGASRALIKGNTIYNLNDDGIRMYTSSLSDIIGNTIYMLLSCGKESENSTGCSDCINGHSDGIQMIYCTKVNVIGNLIYDVRGTSALFMGNNINQSCRFITIANNIFYTPEAGYTVYLWYTQDFDVVNNVILGGAYGSIWYGQEMYRFRMQNNICGMHKLKGTGQYIPAEHTVSYNLWAELHPYFNIGVNNIIEKDPQFTQAVWNGSSRTVKAEDFALKSTSPCKDAGISGTHIPALDFYGKGRNGKPDLGAIEYGGVTNITYHSSQPVLADLGIYPRPMRDILTFEGTDLQGGEVSLNIYNMQGEYVFTYQGHWDTSHLVWDGSATQPGIYTYRLVVDGQEQTGRIIKIK
jgi:parallel beta-helix repeat protein